MSVLSIDPGIVHIGMAIWAQEDSGLWRCTWAREMGPEAACDFVADAVETRTLREVDDKTGDARSVRVLERVVIEGFWLKGGMGAIVQTGSEMETTEIIGFVRHTCRRARVPFFKVANGQDAVITRLTAAGYKWTSRGHGGHAKDAEAVGARGLGLKVRQLAVIEERKGLL